MARYDLPEKASCGESVPQMTDEEWTRFIGQKPNNLVRIDGLGKFAVELWNLSPDPDNLVWAIQENGAYLRSLKTNLRYVWPPPSRYGQHLGLNVLQAIAVHISAMEQMPVWPLGQEIVIEQI